MAFSPVVTVNSKKKWYHYLINTIFIIVFIVLAVAILFMMLFPKKYVVGVSMQPTYNINLAYEDDYEESVYKDVVYAFRLNKGARGDIIVYNHSEKELIKRIIAVAGDSIDIKQYDEDGKYYVYLNGQRLEEEYIVSRDSMSTAYAKFNANKGGWEIELNQDGSITIPEGYIFAMGDNRAHTDDCATSGPVSKNSIVGKVVFSYEYNDNLWNFLWQKIFG